MIIGLTGGIASGKSTVAQILQELGGIVLDADTIAHELIQPDKPAWKEIIQEFGAEILGPGNEIDRGILGEIVFNDPGKLKRLNQITHPRVAQELRDRISEIKDEKPCAVIILEVALLLEAHMENLSDLVWVVWIDEDTQMERLMARNDLDRDEALKRIRAQLPLDEKARRADYVIDNSGTPLETIAQTKKYFEQVATEC